MGEAAKHRRDKAPPRDAEPRGGRHVMGDGGHSSESRDDRTWGGRIGAQLEDLDRSAREAFKEAERALQRGDRILARVVRAAPFLSFAVAFGIGMAVGHRARR